MRHTKTTVLKVWNMKRESIITLRSRISSKIGGQDIAIYSYSMVNKNHWIITLAIIFSFFS